MVIPNFLIIGAAKSGTTSLYHYINKHPDIFMCPVKEPNYFNKHEVTNDKNQLSKAEYLDLFKGVEEEIAIGEASPTYICSEQAPKKIKTFNPDMRLIAILRNPVERAFSNYLHSLRRVNKTMKTLDEIIMHDIAVLNEDKSQISQFVERGFYHEQLQNFYQEFDKSQIRVYLFEDLKDTPNILVKDIFRFLNVYDSFKIGTFKKYNKSGLARIRWVGAFHNYLRKKDFYGLLKKFLSPEILERLRDVVYTKNIELSDEARDLLNALYYEDILKLEKLINRDLSHWLKI